jgi:hypothetical protein
MVSKSHIRRRECSPITIEQKKSILLSAGGNSPEITITRSITEGNFESTTGSFRAFRGEFYFVYAERKSSPAPQLLEHYCVLIPALSVSDRRFSNGNLV